MDFPVHVLAINALGVHLLDYLQFCELVPACERAGRWSFLCVIAPLRLRGGDGVAGQSHRHPVAPSSAPASRCHRARCVLSPAAPTAIRITTLSSS